MDDLRKALVVDDEALIAFDMASTLEDLGCEVVGPALTLQQGLELASKVIPEIALLDINVGGDMVWPLARVLQAEGCRLIFISANGKHEEIQTEFLEAQFVEKPASHTDIAAAIKICLKQ